MNKSYTDYSNGLQFKYLQLISVISIDTICLKFDVKYYLSTPNRRFKMNVVIQKTKNREHNNGKNC